MQMAGRRIQALEVRQSAGNRDEEVRKAKKNSIHSDGKIWEMVTLPSTRIPRYLPRYLSPTCTQLPTALCGKRED